MASDSLSPRRLGALVGGLFTLWVAVGSRLADLDHRMLTFHMVQHLLLMTVAAPLILFATGVTALPRAITHPVSCWLASTATVIGWHIPALFALGMHSPAWHTIEQTSFFAAGVLFWLPVIPVWPSLATHPRWSVPLYLFLATLPCDALSAFLAFCGRVVYPHYSLVQGPFNISALGDQEIAGALMWIWATFAYAIPAVAFSIRMLSPRELASKAESA